MKKVVILLLVLGIVVAGVVVLLRFRDMSQPLVGQNNLDSAPVDTSTGSENAASNVPITTLGVGLIPQNDSNMYGGVKFEDLGGTTRVTITITDPSAQNDSVPHPAHVHTGACPTPGEVKYPLTNVINGESETILNVSLSELAADTPLAVNIHKSAEESGIYYACGDFPTQ